MEIPVRSQEALDIVGEYTKTLHSQSNARFLSNRHQCEEEMKGILKNQLESIPSVLHNVMTHRRRRTSPEIELALAGYFDASAEASETCIQLLRNLESAQNNYQSMDSFLASMADDGTAGAALLALNNNPFPVRSSSSFCTKTRSNFRQVHDKYSSVFQDIMSSHRKEARKLKVVNAVRKLFKTCAVAACGAAAAAAVATGAAPHVLFLGLLIGTAGVRFCPIAFKRRVTATAKKRSGKATSLLRLREQLDAAAKGTYVLRRDLDTVSHLVARLSDGIERENSMATCCAERVEERRPVMEMVRELRRSCSSSRRLAEELEEHVCLSLATIHQARVSVIQEISKQE